MANVADIYPNRYIKPADLAHTCTLTIAGAAIEALRNPRTNTSDRKIVLYFERTTKSLPLNKTQANRLAELLHDPETDHWAGARIRLTRATAPNGLDTIAISLPPPPQVTTAHTEPPATPTQEPQRPIEPNPPPTEPPAAVDEFAALGHAPLSVADTPPALCPIHGTPLLPIATRHGQILPLHRVDGGYCNGSETRPIRT